MHLILTHEQADFDALAALAGAALIAEDALPVLSRRTNRNVRSFITLYGADFSFVDPRDIPQQAVEVVTLVDTQSLVTVKGMGSKTIVQVVDHHPRRKGLPDHWKMIALETGATTTYFVEQLQELGETLSVIQSTLLLLGIYEDTGTLTYVSTTPRDVRAAAWLLEQGASLQVVTDFLNPPLSPSQRGIYDRMVTDAETIDLHGHRIVLVCGEATEAQEEISTLAHKLRDLFDPDALFVLAQTNEGVRLVARSTSEQIDVAAIAAIFGGGGHDRASAALVRGPDVSLENVREQLLACLPDHVRPSITVAQIMSRRPRLLPANTPVQEAARLMSRYGYEGFPVVADEVVVGLLTRRAVDRAINHKLNLTAASLMEAGTVTVHPDDSLQSLQNCMTDSGWGQIPVVDPGNGRIIGIVTRTDVLKTISRRAPRGHPRNLLVRINEALSPAQLEILHAVTTQSANMHLPAYIVGGFVRDLLLSHPSLDFDVVIEGDAISLAQALSEKYGGRVTSHSRFGTAKWYLQEISIPKAQTSGLAFIDFISSRQEFYEHPTALPVVERGSIKHDLHRRDFTINTLAIRLDGRHFGELHDYFGGLADLEKRQVRVLHSLSFVDDPTRMVRAVRYEQRYQFSIEPRTLHLMDEARSLLARLSEERARHELDLILDEVNSSGMLARLHQLGLMSAILDVLPWDADLQNQFDSIFGEPLPEEWQLLRPGAGNHARRELGYAVWLSRLSKQELQVFKQRLNPPLTIYKMLIAQRELLDAIPSLIGGKPSLWLQYLDETPNMAIYAVYCLTGEPALKEYILNWKHIHPITTGHHLKELGVQQGPRYQTILNALRTAWVDGEINSPEQEKQMLEKLITEVS